MAYKLVFQFLFVVYTNHREGKTLTQVGGFSSYVFCPSSLTLAVAMVSGKVMQAKLHCVALTCVLLKMLKCIRCAQVGRGGERRKYWENHRSYI